MTPDQKVMTIHCLHGLLMDFAPLPEYEDQDGGGIHVLPAKQVFDDIDIGIIRGKIMEIVKSIKAEDKLKKFV